jgi:hypothetical protein
VTAIATPCFDWLTLFDTRDFRLSGPGSRRLVVSAVSYLLYQPSNLIARSQVGDYPPERAGASLREHDVLGSGNSGPARRAQDGHRPRRRSTVLKGWQLSGIATLSSGSPIFINQDGDTLNVDSEEIRPNLVAGQNPVFGNSNFGIISSTRQNNREMQISLKYTF